MPPTAPTRAHCWTSYNLDVLDDWDQKFSSDGHVKYCIAQVEQCPDTGRLHVQGYIEYDAPRRGRGLQRLLADDTAHYEPRNGTRVQAANYCRKPDTRVWGPYEWGSFEWQQPGTRADLERLREAVERGDPILDIARDNFSDWCRHHRAVDRYRFLVQQANTALRTVRVTLISGPTGAGKSYRAWEMAPDGHRLGAPNVSGGAVWFDGYDGHDTLIIDDFSGWVPYRLFLQMLDPYPLTVPVKGGNVRAVWSHVIVTSIMPPHLWYPDRAPQEVERRIHETIVLPARN